MLTKEPSGRPALNTSSICKDRVPSEERSITLTFGLSPSLTPDEDDTLRGAVGGSEEKGESIPDYTGNDFYLPLPGSPTLSS